MNWYLITYRDWLEHNRYTSNKKPFPGKDPLEAFNNAKASCTGRFELEDIKLIQSGVSDGNN